MNLIGKIALETGSAKDRLIDEFSGLGCSVVARKTDIVFGCSAPNETIIGRGLARALVVATGMSRRRPNNEFSKWQSHDVTIRSGDFL